MSAPQNTIAVVFDFDDTLTDDSTTRLLESRGIKAQDFWQNRMMQRVREGWDPTLAYLTWITENCGPSKPLGRLSNQDLFEFGKTLKPYPGLPSLFQDLRKLTEQHPLSHPSIEFYVISGGLEQVIRGSSIAKYLDGIWGCTFAENDAGDIYSVKRAISFTEKTRYLFEINKGLNHKSAGPYGVNEAMHESDRRIPFTNMVYVGDGLTDVPCFSLIQRMGGCAFGVFDPRKDESPKKAWERLLAPKRVVSLNAPRYRKTDELGALLRAAVNQLCVALDLRTQTALPR